MWLLTLEERREEIKESRLHLEERKETKEKRLHLEVREEVKGKWLQNRQRGFSNVNSQRDVGGSSSL